MCAVCWQSILPYVSPVWFQLPAVDRAAAIGVYDGALKAIVHAMKYEGRRSLAKPLAALMRERCAAVLSGAGIVVPVPLHSSRRRTRGFNQAADLARHLVLCSAGLQAQKPRTLRALKRTRATPSQTDLPAAQRHRNVRGAFAPAWRAPDVTGQIVVLVDDVSTTGATIVACARVLKEMGASEVRAVTAARVAAPPS